VDLLTQRSRQAAIAGVFVYGKRATWPKPRPHVSKRMLQVGNVV
jgi:hypothetical protein